MITYSLRILIAKPGPAPAAWSRAVVDYIAKLTGVTVNASARLGGPQEMIYVSQYPDYAAFEAAQAKLLADPGYQAMLEDALAKGLFVTGSVDTAFWIAV